MAVLGAIVVIHGAERHAHDDPRLFWLMLVAFDGLSLLVFLILISAAILLRKRSDYHRRLMLLATLGLLGPAFGRLTSDVKYPGTYNARRDNLEGFWKDLFGYRHGTMLATTFFENVSKHKVEGRELFEGEKEENVVLEFKPRGIDTMFVACLWSHWQEGDEELDSFAAITDEPPAEVAAAGHDRCIIPIKEENIDSWLNPDASKLEAMHAILDDRARPYYEHRMAA